MQTDAASLSSMMHIDVNLLINCSLCAVKYIIHEEIPHLIVL